MFTVYLNDIEHGLRKPPRTPVIKQFANMLNIEADLLYRLPPIDCWTIF